MKGEKWVKKKFIFVLVLLSFLCLDQPALAAGTTGWKFESNHWYYQKDDALVKNSWIHDGQAWYYLGSDGVMQTGWLLDRGTWYYLNPSGTMHTGWLLDGGQWYYLQSSGGMQTGWLYDGGVWYYLNPSGAMHTGWLELNQQKYYLTASGAMATGQVAINGVNYTFSNSGELIESTGSTGWRVVDGKRQYIKADGSFPVGWFLESGQWYYFDQSGFVQTGWLYDAYKWYYLQADGKMVRGWIALGGKWYLMDISGAMQTGWVSESGHWFYFHEDGAMQTGWLEDDGKWYYFTKDGYMLTGIHTINGVVYEFNINGVLNKGSVTTSTTYNLTLGQMIDKQMSVLPKTDKYRNDKAYVHSSFIQLDPLNPLDGTASVTGTVTTTPLNVREGDSDAYRIVGTLNAGDTVEILSVAGDWYEIKFGAWRYAKTEDVAYYVNPANFSADSAEYYQFLLLSKNTGASADELNRKILAGKGILEGKGQAFVEASLTNQINELYLISHALLETGNGTSELATGVLVDSVDGVPVEPKVVYNMFGIQARDVDPIRLGAEYAYQNGWFTPEAAIIGGAKFIGEKYIHNPTYQQDTIYEMRWNPNKPGTHQYATDIGWAAKQVTNLKKMYDSLSWYTLHFDVPVYK